MCQQAPCVTACAEWLQHQRASSSVPAASPGPAPCQCWLPLAQVGELGPPMGRGRLWFHLHSAAIWLWASPFTTLMSFEASVQCGSGYPSLYNRPFNSTENIPFWICTLDYIPSTCTVPRKNKALLKCCLKTQLRYLFSI